MGLPLTLLDDYIGAGYLGLVEAARRYSSRSGSEFQSYAFLRIRGAIIDSIRRSGALSPRAYRVLRAIEGFDALREEELSRAAGCPPSPQTKAQRFSRILNCIAEGSLVYRLSLQEAGEEVDMLRWVGENPEEHLGNKEFRREFRRKIRELPPRERAVIEGYYFHNRSLTEIGLELGGISKSWVCRIHTKALKILRVQLSESSGRDATQG